MIPATNRGTPQRTCFWVVLGFLVGRVERVLGWFSEGNTQVKEDRKVTLLETVLTVLRYLTGIRRGSDAGSGKERTRCDGECFYTSTKAFNREDPGSSHSSTTSWFCSIGWIIWLFLFQSPHWSEWGNGLPSRRPVWGPNEVMQAQGFSQCEMFYQLKASSLFFFSYILPLQLLGNDLQQVFAYLALAGGPWFFSWARSHSCTEAILFLLYLIYKVN